MEHNLFKPKSLEEGMHSVVGDCNGVPSKTRWEQETPLFAAEILKYAQSKPGFTILDYGCGCGRIAKEILKQDPHVTVIGLDASAHELSLAAEYINDSRFIPVLPHQLNQKVDLAYSIYCLQHVPAIDLRDCLYRIYYYLKEGREFIYCSSDYRMAVRFDGGGFFDDQFLGVNIREEIERVFTYRKNLFSQADIQAHPILNKMINNSDNVPGGIPHPAAVYLKKYERDLPLFNFQKEQKEEPAPAPQAEKDMTVKKLVLRNRQSPGDVLVMSCAIRSLHLAYPGKFLTDVESPCPQIYEHNPYITNLKGDAEAQVIDMHYPLISDHKMRGFTHPGAGKSGRHFSDGHRKYLEDVLGLEIPRTGLQPDFYLTQDEMSWPPPVDFGNEHRYWVLNAGSKSDYTLKQYHRWQQVVDQWKAMMPDIKLVQVGQKASGHRHEPLKGVVDMVGKTNIRELARLIHHADGVFTCVSFPMHLAAAFCKPCVVVAGGRESTRWELYPDQRFLHTNGALDCCRYDGCWKSKEADCLNIIPSFVGDGVESGNPYPKCLEMISPYEICRAAELYYVGGAINREVINV